MSLILDALKKLDREKAFIRKVTANIADEILKTDPGRSGKKFPLHFAAVAFTALAAAAITYWAVAGFGFLSKTPPPASSISAKLDPQVQSAPKPPEPAQEKPDEINRVSPKTQSDTEGQKPALRDSQPEPAAKAAKPASQRIESAPPARELKREAPSAVTRPPSKAREYAEIQKPQDSAPVPAATPAQQPSPRAEPAPVVRETQEKLSRTAPKVQAQAETPKPSPAPAEKTSDRKAVPGEAKVITDREKTTPSAARSESGSATPPLRLTGIVWSETPSERCAVINGAIISEGASVQGVKVEEIFPNRVRLSHDGRFFEIRLF